MIFTRQTIPNALRAAGRFLRSAANPVREDSLFANDECVQRRRLRCTLCPHYVADSYQCALCTCNILLKTRLAGEACPDGRWGAATRNDDGLQRPANAGLARSDVSLALCLPPSGPTP